MSTFKAEMSLYDKHGGRLYLNKPERDRFLAAAFDEIREHRVFCHILHYTGCRISEALALHSHHVLLDDRVLILRTIKKRKLDQHGNPKPPEYRRVDVPDRLIDDIELVFDLQRHVKRPNSEPFALFPMRSRPRARSPHQATWRKRPAARGLRIARRYRRSDRTRKPAPIRDEARRAQNFRRSRSPAN